MIRSFANDITERIFRGDEVEGVPLQVQQLALTRLQILHAATALSDLEAVTSNRLEFHGDRRGYHCLRLAGLARICFRWEKGHAYEVELIEYH